MYSDTEKYGLKWFENFWRMMGKFLYRFILIEMHEAQPLCRPFTVHVLAARFLRRRLNKKFEMKRRRSCSWLWHCHCQKRKQLKMWVSNSDMLQCPVNPLIAKPVCSKYIFSKAITHYFPFIGFENLVIHRGNSNKVIHVSTLYIHLTCVTDNESRYWEEFCLK